MGYVTMAQECVIEFDEQALLLTITLPEHSLPQNLTENKKDIEH